MERMRSNVDHDSTSYGNSFATAISSCFYDDLVVSSLAALAISSSEPNRYSSKPNLFLFDNSIRTNESLSSIILPHHIPIRKNDLYGSYDSPKKTT